MYIADDSSAVRERLVTLVDELRGVSVVGQAGTAHDAIRDIQSLKPEVAIVDLHMPGGSGLDVVRAIKQGLTGPLVVVVTNYAYPIYRERCLEAGADYFFDKSTEFQRVAELLAGLQRGPASGLAPRPPQQS